MIERNNAFTRELRAPFLLYIQISPHLKEDPVTVRFVPTRGRGKQRSYIVDKCKETLYRTRVHVNTLEIPFYIEKEINYRRTTRAADRLDLAIFIEADKEDDEELLQKWLSFMFNEAEIELTKRQTLLNGMKGSLSKLKKEYLK